VTQSAPLQRARALVDGRRWSDAYEQLCRADASAPLAPADRELLGLVAYLTGRDAESDRARERAYADHLDGGDAESAARSAFWLALSLTLRGDGVRGGGWFAKAQRALDDAGVADSVWRGFLLVPSALQALFGGDPLGAMPIAEQALDVARRYEDVDLHVLALHSHGQALVAAGDVPAGLTEIDEVLVTVTGQAVYPQLAGIIYCAAIETCRDRLDLQRSREWTGALSRWCADQPGLVPFRGQCLVHRAEVLALHGSWPDAQAAAERACAWLGSPRSEPAEGMALYQQGELHRLRGEEASAEELYRRASRLGHDPQPGLALLRLAQGEPAVALAALRRALAEGGTLRSRTRLLPAYVEVAVASGDVAAARGAADELAVAAAEQHAPFLRATALHAEGLVLLGEERYDAALAVLRTAWLAWQDLGVPYEAARARALIGHACRSLGDTESAGLETAAARWTFEQLGAAADLRRLGAHPADAYRAPGGLTLREQQVLRLVATGATNRAVAGQLFLSEKTVARHVANIFLKLGVTSRSAATAYAYEHHLVEAGGSA
jgi:DNA-binding CsgD family transcriptional regulator